MARDFNPDLPQKKEEDYLGYSKGAEAPKADTALGDLLKGAGNLFEMTVTAVDNAYKRTVENEWVQKGEKGVRDVFLGLAELPNNLGLNSEERNRVEAIPDELVKRGERLKLLSDAMAAGRIKPSHYETLLDVEARSLKARYPGYRQFIDDTVKKSIGHNPANALVQDLYRESQAGKAESAQEKWFKHAVDLGLGPDQVYNPDGSKKSLDELQRNVTKFQYEKANLQRLKDETTAASQGLDYNQKFAEDKAGKYVQFEIDRVMKATTNGVAGSPSTWDAFQRKMTDYMTKSGPGGLTPAQQEEVRSEWNNKIVGPTMAALNKALVEIDSKGFSWSQHLDHAARKRIIESKKAELDFYGDRLANKDYGFLYSNGARLKAIEENTALKILDSSAEVRAWSGMNKAIGPQATGILMAAQDKNGLAATARAVIDAAKATIGNSTANNPASMVNEFQKLKAQGVTDPKVYNALADEVIRAAADPQWPTDKMHILIDTLYGDGNKDLLKQVSNPFDFFVKFSGNPAIVERLFQERNQNPENWEKFRTWTAQNFTNLTKGAADEANRVVINSANYNLRWDPNSGMFHLDPVKNPKTSSWSLSGIVEKTIMDPAAEKAVGQINSAIRATMPTIQKVSELSGVPAPQLLEAMVRTLNVDLNQTKQGPGMTILWEQMINSMTSSQPRKEAPAGSTSGGRPMVRTGGKVDHGRLEDNPGGVPAKGGDRTTKKGGDREDTRMGGLESD